MHLYRIFFEDEFGDRVDTILIHSNKYKEEEIRHMASVVRLKLGRDYNDEDTINELIKTYGFIEITNVQL